MSKEKTKYLVIDTETYGDIKYPIAYEIGGVVCDRDGNIYHSFHYAIRETFADLRRMCTAYYSWKFPGYVDRLYEREMEPVGFGEICARIDAIIEHYDIHTIAAYNLAFDLRAMRNTAREVLHTDTWYDRPLEQLCIMCAACDILYGAKYCKVARENGWVTEKGNIKTSAETGYRFISGNLDFEEEHRGLDDCLIEAQILAAVFRKHKKFDGHIRAFPMREVWKREKQKKEKNS